MTVLRFTVPGKPVGVNAQHAGGFARVKTRQAKEFLEHVAMRGWEARRRARMATLTGPVDVLITYFFADERPDGDGPTKSVLDALQEPSARYNRPGAAIVKNDRQVRDHHVRRRVDRASPRVEIVVGPAGEVFTLTELLEQETVAS